MNNTAEKYINEKYATDARCVGSVPTVENGVFINKNSETAAPFTMLFTYNGSTTINSKGTDTNYITDNAQLEIFNLWDTKEAYWLASRSVYSTSTDCTFNLRTVNATGTLGRKVYVWIKLQWLHSW